MADISLIYISLISTKCTNDKLRNLSLTSDIWLKFGDTYRPILHGYAQTPVSEVIEDAAKRFTPTIRSAVQNVGRWRKSLKYSINQDSWNSTIFFFLRIILGQAWMGLRFDPRHQAGYTGAYVGQLIHHLS